MEKKMEKHVGFFKGLHENKKNQLRFFVMSTILIFGIYISMGCVIRMVKDEEILKKELTGFDVNTVSNIEKIKVEESAITLSGWAIKLNAYSSRIRLILHPMNGEGDILLSTRVMENSSTVEYYDSEQDFGKCVYEAKVSRKKMKKNICYEIILVLNYEEDTSDQSSISKFSTGNYILNDELYTYNPEGFVAPKIIDSEIVNVIDNGVLRAYDLVEKIWVYQYDDKMYFIVDYDGGSLKQSNICIPVMPYTSQVEMLPVNRIQYGYDHLGGFYEDMYYEREGILPYRVAVVEVPEDYPVTYINTGLYDTVTNKWRCNFFINYFE